MERLVQQIKSPIVWGGILVLLGTQIVYLLTLTVSCPFWDSGEFIATSYILGIPHPPGTPLYVLLGKLFTLLPLAQISARVNYLSALASSLAVLFSYLVIVNLARRWSPDPESPLDRWIAIGGGLVGAFFMAFSRTFWENACEAEVYGLSSLVMVLCVWLMLKWEASGVEGKRNNNILLLIGYLLFVAVGFHMGALLIAPALFVYLLLISPGTVLNREFIGGVLAVVAAVIGFAIFRSAGASVGLALAMAGAGYAGVVVWKWERIGARNLATWMVTLAVLGLSVHLFLIVRARLDPVINEADPSTWDNLWLVLSRDQYKPPNPFLDRKASWAVQFTKHFYRYWHDQYHMGIRPAWFSMGLPFMIGGVGAITQAIRDKRRFLLVLALVLLTTLFLVFYLNFKEDEVRDRDYFFVAGYHFFALWIGLGAVAIAHWLRGEPKVVDGTLRLPPGGRLFGLGATVILISLSLFPLANGWHSHDRTGFYVAREYAYNMLKPLEPNAIIFTNGDNDTFPLWYLQEVEEVRKDIRVVNLSLLNTHWYIRQVRDYEPKVNVTLPDHQIDELHGVLLPDGTVVLVKDIMVRHIIEVNPGRPIYLAVTVPDQMGLDKRLVMEGLVFRITPEEGEPGRIDVAMTWKNLREVYRYTGLLDEDGYYDASVYKDKNASKLVQNYVAAYVHVAHDALRRGAKDEGMEALEYARRINPSFPHILYTMGYLWMEQGEYAEAEGAFRDMIESGDGSADSYRLLGAALEAQDRLAEAEEAYREAVARDPEDFDTCRILFTLLWTLGKQDQAVNVVEDWLARHPEDEATRRALEALLLSDTLQTPASSPDSVPMAPSETGRR